MKKWRKRLIKANVLGLILACAGALSASAAVTEGKPGETVAGDYAVIVNTSTTDAQSTGTIVFDESGNGVSAVRAASAADPVGQDVQENMRYPVARIAAAQSYGVGTEKTLASPYNGMKTYVCIGESAHCYVWMEKSLKTGYDEQGKTQKIADDVIQTYEGEPYEMLEAMAGGSLPWGRLSVMLETISNASGVYKYNEELTAIHINTPAAASYEFGSMGSRNGLLVHEGQHALFRLMAKSDVTQPYTWLNEGISVAAMDYLWGGTDSNGWMDGIAGNADIRNGSSLFYREYRDNTAQDYGMPYLFVRYLIAQATGGYKPMQLFPEFYATSANCSPDVYLKNVLAQSGRGTSFSDLLAQFYTAIIAQESSGVYGFAGDAVVRQKVGNYPLYMGESGQAHSLAPTAAIMVRLSNGAFQVPTNGGGSIRYMIVSGGRNVPVPEGGDGSAENPYVIDEFKDLALIGNKPGANYRVAQDIEASGQKNLTVTYFSGILDGDGHAIHGLSRPLIGKNSGTIENLTIEAAFDGTFTGTEGIFAQVNSGMIKDCTATGTVHETILRGQGGFSYAAFGAFAGENEVAGRIFRCETRAEILLAAPAESCYVGGIAGVQIGTVKNCGSRGSITVTQANTGCDVYVGGIAGKLESMGMGGLLSRCIHTGSLHVTGANSVVGQICGLADRSVVNTGLSSHIDNCRAKAGTIPAVGSTNAQNAEIPQELEDKTLLTEEQLKQQASYDGWDFGSEWKMGEDGPERLEASDIQEIGTVNTPAECYVGEQIYYWGRLTINGKPGAGITDDMVSGFDSSSAGRKTVKVSYLGKTASFEVHVKEPGSITDFKISDSALKAVKTTYSVGQYFDPAGLYFIATLDGSANRMIYSGFEYEKRPLTAADESVTVSYFGASVDIPIHVDGKKPSSLTLVSKPSKTLYGEGQSLDLSGLRVSLTYNNGDVTPQFGVDEFSSYGICVVKKTGSNYTKIEADQPLTSTDDGAVIYICVGEAMPNSAGAISQSVAAITVKPRLQVENTVLNVVRDVQMSGSILVTGGSGNYTVQKIRESLPQGISVQWWVSGFLYDGTATDAAGSYVSQYLITDTETGQTITPEITVQVHLSDYAELYMFSIPAAWNKDVAGLTQNIAGIIDNTKDTVVLRVPDGTDVSALKINVDYGAGIGVTVPDGYGVMSVHDFRQPVIYELTAPDGKTKRRYTVTVEFYDPDGETSGGSEEIPGGSGSEETPGGSDSEETPGGSGSEETPGGSDSEETPGGSGSEEMPGGEETPESSFGQTVPAAYPAVGTKIAQGGVYYRITSSNPSLCTAELYRPVNKKAATVRTAATVQAGGYTYKVTSIAAKAFKNSRYLKKITIGKYVVSIGNQAFYGCKKLKTVTIPSAVKTVGSQAFARCTALTKAVVGKSVQTIGAKAFYGCKNLKLVTVKGTALKKVKSGAFKGIHPKATIRVPKKKRATYKKLFKREVS